MLLSNQLAILVIIIIYNYCDIKTVGTERFAEESKTKIYMISLLAVTIYEKTIKLKTSYLTKKLCNRNIFTEWCSIADKHISERREAKVMKRQQRHLVFE